MPSSKPTTPENAFYGIDYGRVSYKMPYPMAYVSPKLYRQLETRTALEALKKQDKLQITDKALGIINEGADCKWREFKALRSKTAPETRVALTLECGHDLVVDIPDFYGPELMVSSLVDPSQACSVCDAERAVPAGLELLVAITKVAVLAWAGGLDSTTKRMALLELYEEPQ